MNNSTRYLLKEVEANFSGGPATKKLLMSCLTVLIIGFFAAAPADAQRTPGSVGIGGQIGDPSGLTVKFYDPESISYDFLAAWDLDDFFFLNVHGLYERHLGNTQRVHFFFGPGVFIGFRDRAQDTDTVGGISGTFGLNFVFDQFELYGQLTPRLSLVPETDGEIGGGAGFRFYF